MAVLPGTPGPRGDRGLPGPVGPRGFDGKRGPNGKNGKDGGQGPKGDRGDRGFPGNDGKQGIQGLQGKDGASGKDGSIAGIEHTLLPSDVASDSTPGSGLTAAARDHTHKGVRSIRADAQPQLFSDVVLASGPGISMSQVGNTITLSSSGTGSPLTFTQGLVNILGTVHNTFFTGAGSDQTLFGAAAAGGDLNISSTSHATKGTIFFGVGSTGMQYDEVAQNLILPWLSAGGVLKTDTSGTVALAIPDVDFAAPGAYITDLTGDVAANGPGSAAATIQPNVVDYSKMQQGSPSVLLGNPTGSLADLQEITLGTNLSFSGSVLNATGGGGSSDHKLSIDGSDLTYDFLAAKLTATLPLTMTVVGTAPTPPMTNLRAWYKGDAGISLSGSDVIQWNDQSGNGFDLIPAGGTDLPTFNASVVNSLPGLLFDTTNGNAQLFNSSAVIGNNAPWYMVAVVQPMTPTVGPQTGGFVAGGPVIYPNTPTNNLFPTFGDFGGQTWITCGNQSSAPTTIVSGTPNAVEWGSTGFPGLFSAFQDGNTLAPFTGGNATFTDSGTNIYIGSDGGFTGNGSFSGYICEVFVYSAIPSGPDLADLRGYLQVRYGITIAGATPGTGAETLNAMVQYDGSTIVLNGSNQLSVGTVPFTSISGAPSFVSDHKLSIDGSDTTFDFLAGKLTATLPAVVTVVNPGSAETLDVSVSYDNTSIGAPFSGQLSLIGIPDSTPLAGDIVFPAISAPLTPASGFANVWYDSLAGNLWIENEFSVSTHTAQTESAPTHNFFNALNDDGTFNYAQPDFTDLTGQATYAQIQDETAHTLIGNPGGTLVPPSEITLGAGLQFSGTTLVNTIAAAITQLTGDVAAGPGSGSQAATIQSHVVQFAKMQQVGANHLVGNPTGSTADISEFPLGPGMGFVNFGAGFTLTNTSPLSGLSVASPLNFSGTSITWSGLGSNQAMYANAVGTPSTDSTFTFDPTNKILGAEAIGINGVTPSANQYLAGGNATNSVRAQVAWFVGGSSSPDNPDNTLFLISQNSGATIPAGRTTGIWATARVQPNGYSGTSTPHITEATTLYVDGAPTLTGAVGSLYAFHVAGGASKLDGSLALPGISGVPFFANDLNPMMVDNTGNVTAIPQINWNPSSTILVIGNDTTQWPWIKFSPTDGVDGGGVSINAGPNTVVAGTSSTLRSIILGGGVQNINGTTNITRLDQIYVNASTLNGVTAGSTATTATTMAIAGAPNSGGVTNAVTYTTGYALDVMADATHLGGALVTEGGTVATGGSGGNIIPNVAGNALFITGTTSFQTIKSTTYKDGSMITLWFTSNVTALHNTAGTFTSMSLKGGVNASCLANTCLTLLLKSGSWYEVSRSF